MSVAIAMDRAGSGEIVRLEGQVLHAYAEAPVAPGAPVGMQVSAPDGTELALRGKALGAKRQQDGRFWVRVRLVDLRREQREALQRML